MKSITLISFVLLLSSCFPDKPQIETTQRKVDSLTFDATKSTEYRKILTDFNQNKYVPYYRTFQSLGGDFEVFGIQSNESSYLKDSSTYYASQNRFFHQDLDFLNWLFHFRGDTLRQNLWTHFSNPLSSSIGTCNISPTNSDAALNLIMGYLNGNGIGCLECVGGKHGCYSDKYDEVYSFVVENKSLSVKQIRLKWLCKSFMENHFFYLDRTVVFGIKTRY